ncbi:NADH-quinone oxidoreductase subunit J family protein [Mucilaginibacter psychrotolerans]|uniref:NADH-quinone oxidoreductase subunit J n=1 Tax=Mucilaginibacter psychrotolerans TaxID=1524096 RepID=A0A4Y8S459_9SPHI|nr:NADH-quinone oxidoreductase subunit J [Mucilaginibacter psychrotolerans]TFF33739.1 NADH-quinone oxidoreductase subunit J [Mucilaginibacter psychrotolerans]
MSLVQVLFYVMAFVTLGSALVVAASKNLVRSIFMFFVTLFGLAGLYVLAVADFVAVTQIVIYVGGILVLILFAFMLSGKESLAAVEQHQNRFISLNTLAAFVLAALFLVVMVNVVFKADIANLAWVKTAKDTGNIIPVNQSGINNIGINLMTRYLLPFEAISILLMIALVGSAHLSRKEGNP